LTRVDLACRRAILFYLAYLEIMRTLSDGTQTTKHKPHNEQWHHVRRLAAGGSSLQRLSINITVDDSLEG
jgi:hypothetical protein